MYKRQVYGQIGQTEYIVRHMKEEANLGEIKVVATGGLGRIIASETSDVYKRQQLSSVQRLTKRLPSARQKVRQKQSSRSSRQMQMVFVRCV